MRNIFLILISLFIFSCDEEKDCAGITDGSASLDDCNVCTGGTTGLIANETKDCNGECGGDAVEDCKGECNGNALLDGYGCCNDIEIELWGVCYNIEETTELHLNNDLTGIIPSDIGNLTNLTYLNLSSNVNMLNL